MKDTILLDRCILEDRTKEIDDQYKEEVARLRVDFQLERSIMGKQRREVSGGCCLFVCCHQALVYSAGTRLKDGICDESVGRGPGELPRLAVPPYSFWFCAPRCVFDRKTHPNCHREQLARRRINLSDDMRDMVDCLCVYSHWNDVRRGAKMITFVGPAMCSPLLLPPPTQETSYPQLRTARDPPPPDFRCVCF